MAVQAEKMVTINVLLSVLFVSGAVADCRDKVALLITTPEKMEALSGSCLQIPCNFSANINVQETFNGTRSSFGVWIKNTIDFANNPDQVIFNSSETDNIYPVSLIGDLSQKNCTTLFSSLSTIHTNMYYFRVENGPFVATAHCDPLEITVIDSPPRPSIEIPGDLKEKQSVTITCSAFTPCPHSPPQLTWNLQQDPHNTREQNTDGTFTTKIQKIITLSDEHDGFNFTCSARYPVDEGKDKTAEERTTLSVSYAPKDTLASISPLGLLSEGSQVNLTCSSRANPPVSRFTWFKSSKDGDVNVSDGDFYSFNVTDGRVYFCVATNNLGDEKSPEIRLTIEGEVVSLQWGPIVGGIIGIIGIIVLIGLVVCVWRLKSTHSTAQQTQSQTGEEMVTEEPTSKTEDIHYGEIDFSKQRSELSSASEKDGGQHQDTLYAQVKVSQTGNSITQTADGPEDLYAQVKKH